MVMEWLVTEGLISEHVYRYMYINVIASVIVQVNEHVNVNLTLYVHLCLSIFAHINT